MKKVYVLIPLPDSDPSKCVKNEYLEGGCKNGVLTLENFHELRGLGLMLLKRLQSKDHRDVHPHLLTFKDKEILSSLKQGDVLYITAHGDCNSIGNQHGVNISPSKLVELLEKAGLSKKLDTLKIMACNSALNRANLVSYGSAVKRSQLPTIFEKSFIQCFAEAARNIFPILDVAGYLGYLTEVTSARDKRDYHSLVRFYGSVANNLTIRAKGARITILSPNTLKDIDEVEEQNEDNLELLKMSNR